MKKTDAGRVASLYLKNFLPSSERSGERERLLQEILQDPEDKELWKQVERLFQRQGREASSSFAHELYRLGFRSISRESGRILGGSRVLYPFFNSADTYGVTISELKGGKFSRFLSELETINLSIAIKPLEVLSWWRSQMKSDGRGVIFFADSRPGLGGEAVQYKGEIEHTGKYKMLPKELSFIKTWVK